MRRRVGVATCAFCARFGPVTNGQSVAPDVCCKPPGGAV
jgi:hypothetical protein